MSEQVRCSCPCPYQLGTYLTAKGRLHVVSVICIFDGESHGVRDYGDEGNWELVATGGPFGETSQIGLEYLWQQNGSVSSEPEVFRMTAGRVRPPSPSVVMEDAMPGALPPLGPDEHWLSAAACVGVDPEVFYSSAPEKTVERERANAVAIATCGRCPVLARCRVECDDLERCGSAEWFGIWAGETVRERRVRRRASRQAVLA